MASTLSKFLSLIPENLANTNSSESGEELEPPSVAKRSKISKNRKMPSTSLRICITIRPGTSNFLASSNSNSGTEITGLIVISLRRNLESSSLSRSTTPRRTGN